MLVRAAETDEDFLAIAVVHKAAFSRQRNSEAWIRCNAAAYPRMQFFLAEDAGEVVGFIHWTQRSGFRPEVVLELEQMAVLPQVQGRGVGTKLISDSLPMVAAQVAERGALIKHVVVTTRADNYAKRLYEKTLGAEVEATISNLYSADEVFMIARNITASS